jgi:hypothetical protein
MNVGGVIGELRASFVIGQNSCQEATDWNERSRRHQMRPEDAVLGTLKLHGCLVGFNLGNWIADIHTSTWLLDPANEQALCHCHAEGGHDHVFHAFFPPSTRSYKAAST